MKLKKLLTFSNLVTETKEFPVHADILGYKADKNSLTKCCFSLYQSLCHAIK